MSDLKDILSKDIDAQEAAAVVVLERIGAIDAMPADGDNPFRAQIRAAPQRPVTTLEANVNLKAD